MGRAARWGTPKSRASICPRDEARGFYRRGAGAAPLVSLFGAGRLPRFHFCQRHADVGRPAPGSPPPRLGSLVSSAERDGIQVPLDARIAFARFVQYLEGG